MCTTSEKNIVAVVMACNGYDIVDLGVMVPAETIVQRAIEEKGRYDRVEWTDYSIFGRNGSRGC